MSPEAHTDCERDVRRVGVRLIIGSVDVDRDPGCEAEIHANAEQKAETRLAEILRRSRPTPISAVFASPISAGSSNV